MARGRIVALAVLALMSGACTAAKPSSQSAASREDQRISQQLAQVAAQATSPNAVTATTQDPCQLNADADLSCPIDSPGWVSGYRAQLGADIQDLVQQIPTDEATVNADKNQLYLDQTQLNAAANECPPDGEDVSCALVAAYQSKIDNDESRLTSDEATLAGAEQALSNDERQESALP